MVQIDFCSKLNHQGKVSFLDFLTAVTLIHKRKMQITTTLGYYVIPINLAKIPQFDNTFCWQGWGERSIFMYFWWHYKLAHTLKRNIWQYLSI